MRAMRAGWGDVEVGRLVHTLESGPCSELVSICLNTNGITDTNAARLADVLEAGTCPKLEVLDLHSKHRFGGFPRAKEGREVFLGEPGLPFALI